MQGDSVAWSRDEALANAQNPVFVDAAPKKISKKSKIPTFSQRLALQVEACVSFADGLVDSVKDVFQPSQASKALKKKRNAVRYGFDKIAVVMNSEAGRVFGLEMDTGSVRWSALVEPGSKLTQSSEDEVLIVSHVAHVHKRSGWLDDGNGPHRALRCVGTCSFNQGARGLPRG